MKIIQYCQHVLGIGHFFRTLEISRAFKNYEVILVTGGLQIDINLPGHVREVRLPGLMMDENFKGLFSIKKEKPIEQVKKDRKECLISLFKKDAPDLFLVELYPFGRKAFTFELEPILKGLHQGDLSPSRVVCSLRDILVEKKDPASYENRVLRVLNKYFDALLIHADPDIVKLDETFSRVNEINIPVVYTGFVTPKPEPRDGDIRRQKLGIKPDEILIVASAGGGKVGATLLKAVIKAFQVLTHSYQEKIYLYMFTGPFMENEMVESLKQQADHLNSSGASIFISRFTEDFLSYLAGADLSISMAGYNTSMNILAAQVPALVLPFAQNREQGFRAMRLAKSSALEVLKDEDLTESRLAKRMDHILSKRSRPAISIDLNGAAHTQEWIENWMKDLRSE